MAIKTLGNDLLDLRRQFDPFDDAFRVLGAPPYKFPEMTEAWTEEMLSKVRALRVKLDRVPPSEDAMDVKTARLQAEELEQKLTMKLWATFLSGYDHSPLGRITGALSSLDTGTPEDEEALKRGVISSAAYLDSCAQGTILATKSGRAPLQSSLKQAVGQWRSLLEEGGASVVPASSSEALKSTILDLFRMHTAPAIVRYADVLEKTISPQARGDEQPGLCHIRDGAEHYQQLVDTNTDRFGSADSIHAFGLLEIERLHDKLRKISGKSATANADVGTLLRTGDESEARYKDAKDFMDEVNEVTRDAMQKFAKSLDMSPVGPMAMEEIPAHLAQAAPSAYYFPGKNEMYPGKMMVNPHRMVGEPKGYALAMVYHEAIPGHHAQFEYARKANLLNFRRSAWFNAFIEGWGLYSEELAEEMGLYPTKAAMRGKLAMELLRAARLVVDTGLHALGWSVQQARAYMITAAGLQERAATNEVARYIEFPAQALSYTIGKVLILRMREEARRRLGRAFDVRVFHAEILKHGTVPLSSIAEKLKKDSAAAALA
ncbi:MAG TPA: DUF885 domain-containing protein [Dongiaceae bacterium]|nr:DUF885 domain-containing protein [Dongiaceae bacterium]